MNIRIEEFEEKGDKNADGLYDYCYKGKYYYFDDTSIKVTVRAYSDIPNEASFLSINDGPFTAQTIHSPFLKQIAAYLNSIGIANLKILYGNGGGYEVFPISDQ